MNLPITYLCDEGGNATCAVCKRSFLIPENDDNRYGDICEECVNNIDLEDTMNAAVELKANPSDEVARAIGN